MESGGLLQRSRHHLPANSRIFIAESTFERHQQMSALFHEVGKASEERVAGYIERQSYDYLVVRKVCTVRKNKIDAHVRVVHNIVHLLKNGRVIHANVGV